MIRIYDKTPTIFSIPSFPRRRESRIFSFLDPISSILINTSLFAKIIKLSDEIMEFFSGDMTMNQEKPEHDKHVAQNQEEKVGQDNQQLQPAQGALKDVPVVGLGASSGVLDALKADENFESTHIHLDTKQGRKVISIRGEVIHQGKKERPYRVLLQFVSI
jgi:hypothetical protein